MAGVPIVVDRGDGGATHVAGQVPAEGAQQVLRRPLALQVKMGYLAPGVDAGIGAGGANHGSLGFAEPGQGEVQLSGHGPATGLAPPAGEARAIVGET